MGNNAWFNFNPYRTDVGHIPTTHYESRNLYDAKIVFIYGSISKKCDLFKKSLMDLIEINQNDICSPYLVSFKNDILSDTDIKALTDLNELFGYMIYRYGPDENLKDTSCTLIEKYLSDSIKDQYIPLHSPGEDIVVKEVDSTFETDYPYQLNTIDTGVPTDTYYEIKNLSEGMVAVIVYDKFFDYLFSNNNIKEFIRHLVLKLHEFMTIQEIAKLKLFTSYIKNL
jgi:hypothetical protein